VGPLTAADIVTWTVAALATLGVVVRPWGLPEAVWAVAGALLLVAGSWVSLGEAWSAVAQGGNVYLFLIGMMLLAEVARTEGLFDWLAAVAARRARGSARRLFGITYAVGIVVTTLLSNDATAVVLTPAVAAVARAARAPSLPYLFVCAFIANAASFVLPISNPANLVVFGNHLPSLLPWLARFALPSLMAIAVTYLVLRATQRRALDEPIARDIPVPRLSAGGQLAAGGIALATVLLLASSATGLQLGIPTGAAGVLTAAATLARTGQSPWRLLRGISWGILPLVAGLFVLVEGLDRTGLLLALQQALHGVALRSASAALWTAGVGSALAGNVTNNLPIALVAGRGLNASALTPALGSAVLVGVDLGPNLSVTGSLATILWLLALRREGEQVSAARFLRLGICVMPPALLAALAVVWLQGR
jgi:arsenical pump membrane protein